LIARLRAQKIDLEVEVAAQKLDSRIEAERLKSPIDESLIARLRAQKLYLRIDAERLKSPIDQAMVHQLETDIQAMNNHIAQLTAQLPPPFGANNAPLSRTGTNAISFDFHCLCKWSYYFSIIRTVLNFRNRGVQAQGYDSHGTDADSAAASCQVWFNIVCRTLQDESANRTEIILADVGTDLLRSICPVARVA
jgi:hypothetical protein